MNELDLAYLAGALDSDGCFMIRRSTYHKRVMEDASNPTFSERICLKQVTPEIPNLLHQAAGGGRLGMSKPSSQKNGRPLHVFDCTDKVAARLAGLVVPFLRIKKKRAELLLELRESKSGIYSQVSYWYAKEHPGWEKEEMLTSIEVYEILGYKTPLSVCQATQNGTLLALPYDRNGTREPKPRFPRGLVEEISKLRPRDTKRLQFPRPRQLIEWRERLWKEIREYNKIGLHGTSVNHLTGSHTPAS